MTTSNQKLKDILCDIGLRVCRRVHESVLRESVEERSQVHKEEADDTIYQIDKHVEDILLECFGEYAETLGGMVLVAEGIAEHGIVLPEGMSDADAAWRVMVDPIDGTRGIMYDKRSAFFLAGAAPNRGPETTLRDIDTAVMAELPTSRSQLSDTLWAIRGQGAHRMTHHLSDGTVQERSFAPSKARSILGGFAQIARFFPPGKALLAQIEDQLIAELFPNPPEGRAILFEDQYISTGGQLYEVLLGHDRFIAELRTGLYRRLAKDGIQGGLTCHPYDCCAFLIGEEAGVIVTDGNGNPFDAPFNTTAPCDWILYANEAIRNEVEPVLLRLLKEAGMAG